MDLAFATVEFDGPYPWAQTPWGFGQAKVSAAFIYLQQVLIHDYCVTGI